jgi:5-deoxy-D-glucuronate isomerase
MMSWYKPAGTLATADAEISLTPKDAGWEFCGFYAYNFAKNPEVKVELNGREAILLPERAVETLTMTTRADEAASSCRKARPRSTGTRSRAKYSGDTKV